MKRSDNFLSVDLTEIVYDGGSDWYVLNREFVHYVTFGDDPLINGLRHIFNYSLLPCEVRSVVINWLNIFSFSFSLVQTFFHTVISNSRYCDSYIRNNFRLVHWNRERGCKCQHKNVVDWCGCSPLVYRIQDRQLLNVRIHYFVFEYVENMIHFVYFRIRSINLCFLQENLIQRSMKKLSIGLIKEYRVEKFHRVKFFFPINSKS